MYLYKVNPQKKLKVLFFLLVSLVGSREDNLSCETQERLNSVFIHSAGK
ncbi:hypothetical protein GLYMA_03G176651v4 [Glycine max]|nr:hypothetical protein GLYMA_03G176651v4 [Glycine max]